MNNDQKIKLLASGDYFLYTHVIDASWYFPLDQKVRRDTKSVVAHKKDKDIADIVVNNPDIEILWKHKSDFDFMKLRLNFFESYNHKLEYKIKPQKQDHVPDIGKKVQINNMEDLNDLETTGDEMLSDGEETISITDKDGRVYEFEKPEFECELKFMAIDGYIYGTVKGHGYHWSSSGKCYVGRGGQHVPSYNLTPIQKKWYEDEANFPALMLRKKDAHYLVVKTKDKYLNTKNKYGYELVTKQERDSLYCEE